MLITRKAEFSASHICRNPELPDSRNREIYAEEANPQGHGHNFVLQVTVAGDPDPVTGMVFDLKELRDIIQREVLSPMDHRFLNYEVPPFDRLIPTVENLAVEIWNRLARQLNHGAGRLHQVRLYETEDLWVDYFGEAVS